MIEALPFEQSPETLAIQSALPHVLIVVDQFPRILGGGERVALKMAELLPQYGFRASILTFCADPECEELRRSKSQFYVLPLKRTYDLNAFRAALALKQFLKSQQVQLVQTFFESSDLWAGLITKSMSDAKLVWSRRDMGILRGRKHTAVYRLMAKMPDAVFAVSEQVRRHCITADGIEPTRVKTVYNGLDLTQWEERATPTRHTRKPVVATVGNIRRVKGYDVLARAAGIIAPRFPQVTFRNAGAVLDTNFFAELEGLVSELGLTGRFDFVGASDDVRTFLMDADVFVLPSRSEGFSNAIIEAMAAGLPVVATDVGGNGEAVENGVSGIIVPAEDPAALAEAIMELLANPERAKEMGNAGKEIAAKKFSIDSMMIQITSVYRGLIARDGSFESVKQFE